MSQSSDLNILGLLRIEDNQLSEQCEALRRSIYNDAKDDKCNDDDDDYDVDELRNSWPAKQQYALKRSIYDDDADDDDNDDDYDVDDELSLSVHI